MFIETIPGQQSLRFTIRFGNKGRNCGPKIELNFRLHRDELLELLAVLDLRNERHTEIGYEKELGQ